MTEGKLRPEGLRNMLGEYPGYPASLYLQISGGIGNPGNNELCDWLVLQILSCDWSALKIGWDLG